MMTHVERYLLVLTMVLLGSLHNCNGNPVEDIADGNDRNYHNRNGDSISNYAAPSTPEEPLEDTTVSCLGPACSIPEPQTEKPYSDPDSKITQTKAKGTDGSSETVEEPVKSRFLPTSYFRPQNTNVICSRYSPEGCPKPKYVTKFVTTLGEGCGTCYPAIMIVPDCPCSDCWNACDITHTIQCPCNNCSNGCYYDWSYEFILSRPKWNP